MRCAGAYLRDGSVALRPAPRVPARLSPLEEPSAGIALRRRGTTTLCAVDAEEQALLCSDSALPQVLWAARMLLQWPVGHPALHELVEHRDGKGELVVAGGVAEGLLEESVPHRSKLVGPFVHQLGDVS